MTRLTTMAKDVIPRPIHDTILYRVTSSSYWSSHAPQEDDIMGLNTETKQPDKLLFHANEEGVSGLWRWTPCKRFVAVVMGLENHIDHIEDMLMPHHQRYQRPKHLQPPRGHSSQSFVERTDDTI